MTSPSVASPLGDDGSPPIRVRGNSVSEKIESTVEEINETQRARNSIIDIMKIEKTEEAREAASAGKPIRDETIQERQKRMSLEEADRERFRRLEGEEHAEMNKYTRTLTAQEQAEEERRQAIERKKSLEEENIKVTKASNWAKEELAMREAEKAAAVKRKLEKAATLARDLEENRKDGMTRFHMQKQKLEALEREAEEEAERQRLKLEEEKRAREEEERKAREEAERIEREKREEAERIEREKREEAERIEREKREEEERIALEKRQEEEQRARKQREEEEQARKREEEEERKRKKKLRDEMINADKAGFLNKKGGSKRNESGNSKFFSRRNWNRRYFVLTGSTSTLRYFKQQVSVDRAAKQQSLGAFDLRASTVTQTTSGGRGDCIRIESKGREGFIISCESADECEQWMRALTLHTGQQSPEQDELPEPVAL